MGDLKGEESQAIAKKIKPCVVDFEFFFFRGKRIVLEDCEFVGKVANINSNSVVVLLVNKWNKMDEIRVSGFSFSFVLILTS